MTHCCRIILTSLFAVVCSQGALAVTVHTWKDENGVTHFSDEPSPAGVASDTIEFSALDNKSQDATQNYYSIANQWERLKAERDATNQRRAEKAKLRAEAAERQAALEQQVALANANPPSYPLYGPIAQRGVWGANRFNRGFRGGNPYGQDRYARRGRVHPNYYSPFHDRVQPQSIRSKPLARPSNNYRGRTGRANAGFAVRF
ncbi:MAG: DUF4124 domain-containing protein [Pseudomonadota bacterium]